MKKLTGSLPARLTWKRLAVALVLAALAAATPLAVHNLGFSELDGDAADNVLSPDEDWSQVYANTSAAVQTTFLSSAVEAAGPDVSYFSGGGSKDVNDIPLWAHSSGDVAPDKDDITNAFAAAYVNGGDLILYFGADRFANSGDAQIGFWFFRNPVGLNPNGTFSGAHATGDVLILSDFTQGGKVSTIKVYEWVGSGGSDGPLDLIGNGQDCTAMAPGDLACGLVNPNDGTTSPWPYQPKSGTAGFFPKGSFFEGGINLSALLRPRGETVGCLSSYLAETRSSQSPTAQLKDFALGAFNLCDARIQITPQTATNSVNDPHTFTIAIEKKDGSTGYQFAAATGAAVTSSLTNSDGATASFVGPSACTTNGSGACTVTISSSTSGSSTVSSTAIVTVDNQLVTRTTDGSAGNSGAANKRWVDARIAVDPLAADNVVGDPHTITATVEQDDGLTANAPGGDAVTGFGPAGDGLTVTFSLPSNGAGATFVSGNTCTLSGGNCSVQINSTGAGSVTIHASTTFTVGGLTLTRATGTGAPNGPDATKDYVDASITIGPSATNRVGSPHTFTVHVEANDGSGGAPVGGAVPVISFASGAPGSVDASSCAAGTNASGNCTVTINSSVTGTFTAHAAVDVTVGSLTVHRETDGQHGSSGDATKTYVNARIAIGPPTATNVVGEPHVFTVHLDVDSGNGWQPAQSVVPTVTFPTGTPSTVNGSSCAAGTDAAGNCAVAINSTVAGSFSAHAAATVTVGGLPIALQTDGQGGNGGDAVKTYVDARISIGPSAVNGIGEPHTFTVHVDRNAGSGFVPAAGVVPAVTFVGPTPGSVVSSCSAGTDATGNCTVTINSALPGGFTVHAAADIPAGAATVHRETNGQNGSSGTATKTYLAGSLAWRKVNGSGAPLAGATFQACRTHNYVSATGLFAAIAPVCATVIDNGGGDVDAAGGSFQMAGLVLGRYTVQETVPPAGYSGDTTVAAVDVTTGAPSGSVARAFVNTLNSVLGGRITPTTATCQTYNIGTSGDHETLMYGVKSNKISNVAPGVFFYFSHVVAPAASFTIDITQGIVPLVNPATFPLFGVQQGNQVWFFNADCTASAKGKLTSTTGGQVKIAVAGATVGQTFIIQIKYSTAAVVGKAVPNPSVVNYVYTTKANGVPGDSDSVALTPKTPIAVTSTTSTAPTSTTTATTKTTPTKTTPTTKTPTTKTTTTKRR